MLKGRNSNSDQPDRSIELLAVHYKNAFVVLNQHIDNHGISIPVLKNVMDQFFCGTFELPKEAACRTGCAYCCHLRVDISIPELLVIFHELSDRGVLNDMTSLQVKIRNIVEKGNTLKRSFWQTTQTACPFLDDQSQCLIYTIRPFACRAYHSIDRRICHQGFDSRGQIQIPCFSLYKATADTFASVFVKALAENGFASYPVGFIKGLDILFNDASITDQWLNKKDVFHKAML